MYYLIINNKYNIRLIFYYFLVFKNNLHIKFLLLNHSLLCLTVSQLLDSLMMIKNTNRYVMYPIVYDNIYKLYNQLKTSFWIAEEVDLSQDLHDWNTKLTDNEKVFIKNILSFFVSSDAVIQENLFIYIYE